MTLSLPGAAVRGWRPHAVPDLLASLVVFLVALPLCIGVAVASGVPAELGLVTGIVGGLVVGSLPGSSLQVSGPAAGLTVLVYTTITDHGLAVLGPIVLAAGVLQVLLGVLRFGRWFQAISLAVVQGMLAGIGLLILAGQLYALADQRPRGTALENVAGLPALAGDVLGGSGTAAAALGALAVALCAFWKHVPGPLGRLPGPLAAAVLATAVAALTSAPARRLEVSGLAGAVSLPSPQALGRLVEADVVVLVVAFALIASAETLFSAAAVDRMHHGPRTRYDAELVAQGVGNGLCGLLGALPLTAVIVRSSANVAAGARTKAARVLHGAWLLAFAALVPAALGVLPVAVLAGILIHAGWKLLNPPAVVALARSSRGEAAVMGVTAVAIVATTLLEGVLIGLVAALAKCAWEVSHLHVTTSHDESAGTVRITLSGNATFLRLPRLVEALESLPVASRVHLDLREVRHLDVACRQALEHWVARHRGAGGPEVVVAGHGVG